MRRNNWRYTATFVLAIVVSCSRNTETSQTGAKQEPSTPTPAASIAPAPPPKPASITVTIPAGTVMRVRTMGAVSTKTHKSGESVQASLEAPIIADGVTAAEKGAAVTLLVAQSDPGGRVDGRASIGLRAASVEMSGRVRNVSTNVHLVQAAATKKKDAIKVGAASAVGAAIGAIAGGGKGAAIGAASGAGAGTGVVLATRGDPAVIVAESILGLRLQQPITLELAR
jgi:hypothetical protein